MKSKQEGSQTMYAHQYSDRRQAGLWLAFASVAATFLLGPGCSSSSLVDKWSDPSYSGPPMSHILVIAVKKDPARRRIWEDGFVNELASFGVKAIPSYSIFPSSIPDTATVVKTVKERGFDGLLVVRRIQSDTTATYIQGYTTAEPVTKYNPWNNTYSSYFREIQHPGYTEIETRSRHEVNVWYAREGGKLVWTGIGEALDTGSANSSVREEIINMVCPEMSSDRLIPPKK